MTRNVGVQRTSKPFAWPIIILVSADLMVISAFLNLPEPIRVAAAFWFLLLSPGMAFIKLFGFVDVIVEWVLAIALSITIDIVVSGVFFMANIWSAIWVDFILAFIASLGAIAQIILALRQRRNLAG